MTLKRVASWAFKWVTLSFDAVTVVAFVALLIGWAMVRLGLLQ